MSMESERSFSTRSAYLLGKIGRMPEQRECNSQKRYSEEEKLSRREPTPEERGEKHTRDRAISKKATLVGISSLCRKGPAEGDGKKKG